MKQLQNNFTTPEQSKRLLELGVPADSADCYYVNVARKEIRQGIEKNTNFFTKNHVKYMPCWSVGRLIEIAHLCSGSTLSYKEEADELKKFKEAHKCETIIEAIIMCIEDACSIGGMDFSKLEE